jgi:tight adherence protein B
MTVVLGIALGVGLVLVVSPFLWPAARIRRRPRSGAIALLRERLSQAGLHSVTVPALFLVSVLLAVAVAALCFAIVPVLAIALTAGLAALALPTIVVGRRARSRRRSARVLWPDVVDHLVSGVRSGLALPDSVVTLAHSGPLTTRESFAAFERDYRATGNFGLCLDTLKTRLADPVADRILETLRMSREVGGSELTTVLRNLASYLRQEAAIRSEVQARQSWVVNAARLGVAAPWLILLLLASRPEAAAAYNTPAGILLILGGLVVTVIAYRVMIALGRIPEERRWFS